MFSFFFTFLASQISRGLAAMGRFKEGQVGGVGVPLGTQRRRLSAAHDTRPTGPPGRRGRRVPAAAATPARQRQPWNRDARPGPVFVLPLRQSSSWISGEVGSLPNGKPDKAASPDLQNGCTWILVQGHVRVAGSRKVCCILLEVEKNLVLWIMENYAYMHSGQIILNRFSNFFCLPIIHLFRNKCQHMRHARRCERYPLEDFICQFRMELRRSGDTVPGCQ